MRAAAVALCLSLVAGFLPAPEATAQVPPAAAEEKGVTVPAGAYWAMTEVIVEQGQSVTHRHGLEFIYALQGEAVVRIGAETRRIPQGAATLIPAGVAHTHLSPAGAGRILAFQLAPAEGAWGDLRIVRTRRTGVLSGFRQGRQMARLTEVRLQPQSQTPVHTHPGPEAVYVLEGPIVVQTEGKLTMALRGDLLLLPGDTPLQARYIGGTGMGRFLALFVVAEDAPFSVPIPTGFAHPPNP